MRKTFLGFGQPGDLASALVLSTLLAGCGSSAITGQQAVDAAARGDDAAQGSGGTMVANGGTGGSATDTGGAGGGPGGAAGGTPGAGGANGSGAGGIVATGGRPGSGGRAGAGGGSAADAGVDASSSCPAQLPISGGACQGPLSCSYGQSSCCGYSSSAWTCTCLGGSFSCSQTVECNIICPGHDASVGIDSGIDTSTERDTSSADSAGVGAACGGPSDPPCTGFTFCDWPDNRCGTGVQGACAAIPRGVLCAISPAPVCGCDGQNYLGGCQATQAGVDVSTTASCTPPAGWFRCGWTYCQHNVHYCSAQVGGAVTNPGTYTCAALPATCNGAPSCTCIGANGRLCSISAQGDVTVTQEVP